MTSSSADDLKFTWWDMIKSLFFLLDKKRVSYSVYSIILISVLFYDLVPIWIVGKIIDFLTNYTPGNSLLSFYKYVAFFTISWGMSSFIRLSVKRKLTNIQYDTTYFTRVTGFERLMDFSIKWHDSENSGNKVQRIQSGTDALRQLQRVLSKDVFRNMTAVIGVLTAFLFLKPMFVLYSLVYIALFITVQMSFYKRLVEINRANNILNEKASGTYFEGLNNILTIKTLGVKDDFKKNINSREELTRDSSKKKSALVNNKWKMFQTINALAIGGILFFSGMSFLGGAITLGSIFIIYSYFQKLNGAVTEFMEIVEDLITTKISIARMMPIFKNESSAHQGDQPFPSDWESIAIENASFMYQHKSQDEGEKDTLAIGLDTLNLKIKRHDKVGVVGESGSGKSTFAKMMLGLYEFTAGKFKIGDSSFYEIKHSEITSNIALVLQDSEMFNLSLKENITLMRNFDQVLFNKAILISQLESVIKKLPAGVDTLIGEKGYRLSGGERQRIGIARAIYKDPQILILDEATSSLDSKTESLIQKAFEEHLTQKTIVSIAHRITTLKNVDKILVFEKGKIIEEGTFKELSKNPSSHFYHISHLQQKKGVDKVQTDQGDKIGI